jgi:hypothetical protein
LNSGQQASTGKLQVLRIAEECDRNEIQLLLTREEEGELSQLT